VEERQQVVAELPGVVGQRGLLEFAPASLEPFRRELVERRSGRRFRGVGDAGRPDAALDVGQDVAQLGLGLPARPSVLGAAQRDEVPASVGAEAQREDAAALALAFDDLACRSLRRGSSYCVPRVRLDRAGPIGSSRTPAPMELEGGGAETRCRSRRRGSWHGDARARDRVRPQGRGGRAGRERARAPAGLGRDARPARRCRSPVVVCAAVGGP